MEVPMRRFIAAFLAVIVCASLVACSGKQGGSSSDGGASAEAVDDKTQLAEKIAEVEPLIFGNANEQTRKYLSAAIDNARRRYKDKECTSSDMRDSISDMKKAAAVLKDGTFNKTEIKGLAAFAGAERGAAPDGTSDSVKFTDEISSAADPFEGKLAEADGILLRFFAEAPKDRLTITLKAGESSFSASLPIPKETADLRASFDFFKGAEGAYLIDVLPQINAVALSASGVCWVSKLEAYTETIEAPKNSISVCGTSSVSNEKFYKITNKKNGSVLTFGPPLTERNSKDIYGTQNLVNKEEGQTLSFCDDPDDDTCLWQIYKAPSGKYRIINKGTGCALAAKPSFELFIDGVDMTTSKQEFGIKSVSGGVVITYVDSYCITPLSSKPILKKGTFNVLKLTEYDYGEWKLVKADEFDEETLDRSTWRVTNAKTRGDTEPIFYRDSPENHYIENGNLVIKTKIEEYKGYHATSASIDTAGRYAVAYGRVDVRAKLPGGAHIWPAIWMMGDEYLWPHDGEIDVMESGWLGETPDPNQILGSKDLSGTLHWFGDVGDHICKGYHFRMSRDKELCDEYHVYSVEWDSSQVRILVDGMLYLSLNTKTDPLRWGFGAQPHYLILNTSVSGPGEDRLPSGMPETSKYYIDYVRFYKRSGEISVTDDISVEAGNATAHRLSSGTANEIVTSPNGKYTAVVGRDQKIAVYKTKSMKEIDSFKGDGKAYHCAAFSPDSKLLVAGAGEGIMTFCELETGACWDVKNANVYHEAVAFTSDGSYIITGGRNYDTMSELTRYMFVFDAQGNKINQIQLESDIRAIASKGDIIALALGDSTVRIYDSYSFAYRETLKGHTSSVRGIDLTEDGKKLVTSDENGNIFVWDTVFCKKLAKMNNECSAAVRKVRFLDGGRRVLCASDSGDARIFTVSTGRLYSLMGGFDSLIRDIAVSRDGKLIAACSYDGSVRTYRKDGSLLEAVKVSAHEEGWIGALAFCTNKRVLFGMKFPDFGIYGMRLTKR